MTKFVFFSSFRHQKTEDYREENCSILLVNVALKAK